MQCFILLREENAVQSSARVSQITTVVLEECVDNEATLAPFQP